MRESVTVSVESARITSFFFFSPNTTLLSFTLTSLPEPLYHAEDPHWVNAACVEPEQVWVMSQSEQKTQHRWQMHQLREQLLGWSLTLSSRGYARRGAGAVLSEREKCIFPHQKEAVYRPSKKLISESVQRWLRDHWEDVAACVWSRTFVPASALLCLQSPCFEPALRTHLP